MTAKKKRASKATKKPASKPTAKGNPPAPLVAAKNGGRIKRGGGRPRGNPYFIRLRELREKFDKAISDEDRVKFIRALMVHGAKGDAACARVAADYLIGKPPRAPKAEDVYPGERSITLPKINRGADAAKAMRTIRAARMRQEITAEDADILLRTVEGELAALTAESYGDRLAALESKQRSTEEDE